MVNYEYDVLAAQCHQDFLEIRKSQLETKKDLCEILDRLIDLSLSLQRINALWFPTEANKEEKKD